MVTTMYYPRPWDGLSNTICTQSFLAIKRSGRTDQAGIKEILDYRNIVFSAGIIS